MRDADLVIRNGWIVSPTGRQLGGVAIAGRRIMAVGTDSELPHAFRMIDAEERFIIPGLIDPHVHMTSEEDASITAGLEANLPSESLGMAHGGVTSFGHFVGRADAPLVPQLDETIAALDRGSYVDCFLHAFIMDHSTLTQLPTCWARGVTSFKHFFTAYGHRQGEHEGLGSLFAPVGTDVLLRSMAWIARHGPPGVAMVHAEDGDVVDFCREALEGTRSDLAAWSDSRPNVAEWLRVQGAVALAELTGCPLYVVHTTTEQSCAIIAEARARGLQVDAEVGPHWLTHDRNMENEIGCWGKVNPPLRSTKDVEALWAALRNGDVSCIGTDHGTGGRTRLTKESGGGKHDNIWAARPGVRGGSEHMLPVLMTYGVAAGRLTMEQFVCRASAEPARVFGLWPAKGQLSPGADADVVVVDPDEERVVDTGFYHATNEVSVYTGQRLRGLARTVVVGGRVVVDEFETVAKGPAGRYLPRGGRRGGE